MLVVEVGLVFLLMCVCVQICEQLCELVRLSKWRLVMPAVLCECHVRQSPAALQCLSSITQCDDMPNVCTGLSRGHWKTLFKQLNSIKSKTWVQSPKKKQGSFVKQIRSFIHVLYILAFWFWLYLSSYMSLESHIKLVFCVLHQLLLRQLKDATDNLKTADTWMNSVI